MKQENKKYLTWITLIFLGILIGYFLFAGSNIINSIVPVPNNGSNDCGNGITTTPATDDGDRICTRVCLPKPPVCRDPTPDCPVGTSWSCSGTLAMNCGCYPPVSTPTNPTPTTSEGGARGCLTDPSVCVTGEICDTGLNKCITVVG